MTSAVVVTGGYDFVIRIWNVYTSEQNGQVSNMIDNITWYFSRMLKKS